jgi:hypothetical protein
MLVRLKGVRQDDRGRVFHELRFVEDDGDLVADGTFPDGTADMVVADHSVSFSEMTAPAAPAANKVVLFCRDNGSGKTQLCARFPTGAIQQVAIEP